MRIAEMLEQLGGLDSMAGELGISRSDATRGAEALLPAVLGGFKKQAQGQASGVDGLGGMLGTLGGGSLLQDLLAPEPTDVGRGNEVLGQIFGSKDTSRSVARGAASQSGLDPDLLKKMLPMLAMAVTGILASRAGQKDGPQQGSEGLGSLLGGLLGGTAGTGASSAGGLGALLDMDGDGNSLDDILGMLGDGR